MNPPAIHGKTIDAEGRCVHWHSALDIVAIKFACCKEFYACFECHQETAGHEAEQWPKNTLGREPAILCGACKTTLTIAQYRNGQDHCPHCHAPFNPKCALHWHLYFDTRA